MSELTPYSIQRPASARLNPLVEADQSTLVLDEGLGLEDCWQVIHQRSRLILMLVALSVAAIAGANFVRTPQFTSSTTLLIDPEPPQVLDVKLITESENSEEHDYYKTQYELLKSRDLAQRVIRELGLERSSFLNPADNESQGSGTRTILQRLERTARAWRYLMFGLAWGEAQNDHSTSAAKLTRTIDAYLKRLQVVPEVGTRLVTVSFTAPSPELAARIADRHVRDFVRQGLELRSDSRRSARQFLENQLLEIKSRVQQSEGELNEYRHEKGILSFEVADKNQIAAERMAALTRAMTDAETVRITAQAQMGLLAARDYGSLPQVVSNPTITALKPEVNQLQSEYASLAAAFNPEYPKLAELKAKLGTAQTLLNREIMEVARAVQRDYDASASRETELRSEIEAEKERDLKLNDATLQDAVLSSEVEINRQLYKNVLERMQEMALGEQEPLSNIRIVDRAVPPLAASSPRWLRSLAITTLMALFFATGLAFTLDQVDNRLKTGEEIERYLKLANLAVAPDFEKLRERVNRYGRLHGNGFWLRLRSRFVGGGSAKPAIGEYLPGRAETYRSIRTALMFSRAGAPPRSILITSALDGEGKTWTSVNTALAFAQTNARTLLIDADLRRPRCHSILDVENTTGLSEILVGQCDPLETVRVVSEHKLHLISAGSRVPNPAELLTSVKMRETLEFFVKDYQFVIIDSAPVTYASDTVGIATMAEGVVVVAGSGTPKQTVRRCCERLALVGAKVLGVVLNRVGAEQSEHRESTKYWRAYERLEFEDEAPLPHA